jgi:SAM-dependent methyltransferase
MNPENLATDPQVTFYDLDYPWPEDEGFQAAVEDPFAPYTLNDDINLYVQSADLFKEEGAVRILDLCCGSGRLSIPLARAGHHVTGVDLSEHQLEKLRLRLEKEPKEVADRVKALHADVCELDTEEQFECVFIGFNSLNLLNTLAMQRKVIAIAAKALRPGGFFVADMLNPMQTNPFGLQTAVPMGRRHDPQTGRSYTKFGIPSAMDANQMQTINGWYDVVETDHVLKRLSFTLKFRFIFPQEFSLLTEIAGLETRIIASDYGAGGYSVHGRKLIGLARKTIETAR